MVRDGENKLYQLQGRFRRKNEVKNDYWKFNPHAATVPPLVSACINYLQQEENLQAEGIFRISGNMSHILDLKKKYSRNCRLELQGLENDVHDVSGLLKLWFREMEDPMLTFQLYDVFIEVAKLKDAALQMQCIQCALAALPRCTQAVLRSFLQLLYNIQLHSKVNKMHSSNLSIVFAPTLLRPEVESIEIVLGDAEFANGTIKTLIENPGSVFEAKSLSDLSKLPAPLLALMKERIGNLHAEKQAAESKEPLLDDVAGAMEVPKPTKPLTPVLFALS